MKRFEVMRYYWDNIGGAAQYTVKDTKHNDTIKDTIGFTQLMTKTTATWLSKELNTKEVKK